MARSAAANRLAGVFQAATCAVRAEEDFENLLCPAPHVCVVSCKDMSQQRHEADIVAAKAHEHEIDFSLCLSVADERRRVLLLLECLLRGFDGVEKLAEKVERNSVVSFACCR